ncbi:hypothetical protein JZO86_07790 [Enterococcus ureasiticus]|uniref:hypothetical protein n=1 Tax=Enterococcus TaxID=1350 RepID=UPI001A8C0D15|nr:MULTISPECIES: hypothetical protein [Enterococcus]MBO0433899.1 hypothetical protein [Enterococcus sp. DIV0849a]MBO0473603.1 hypothetical protein [Enterococcus ureasiticus]
MDNRKIKQDENMIGAEKQSVTALKNTFSNVKEIYFEKSSYDPMTSSYRMFITMINTDNKKVSFSYGFSNGREKVSGYPIKDKSIQKRGTTTSKVKVVFSNESTEEI